MPEPVAFSTLRKEQAVRERRTHLGFLEALLQAELERGNNNPRCLPFFCPALVSSSRKGVFFHQAVDDHAS
jgi:hypothetical protein